MKQKAMAFKRILIWKKRNMERRLLTLDIILLVVI